MPIETLPLWAIIAVFVVAAVLVCWAGRRLPAFAAAIANRTGLGQAFVGMLLLGGITTLPELATTSSAALIGAGALALNNVFGSAAFNILLLALADAVLGRSALTAVIARPVTLLQGVLGMLLLAATGLAIVSGEASLPGTPLGVGATLLFALCLGAMWVASRYETRPAWVVVGVSTEPAEGSGGEPAVEGALGLRLAGLAAMILVGGFLLAESGDAIAARTGIASGLVGLAFVAVATSLPEVTVVATAVRRGAYGLAVGDVFGANLFNVAMIFTVDLLDGAAPALRLAGSLEIGGAMLALILTGIFVIGLLERHDRTVLRMGYDSLAALLVYPAGLFLLFLLSS